MTEPWEVWSAVGAVGAATFTASLAAFALIQIRDGRRSAQRQLRAYVGLDSSALESDIEVGKPIRIVMTVKNYGQTPAYRCTGSVNCVIWDFSGDSPMEYLPHDLDPEPFGVMQPGHVLTKTRISPDLTEEQAIGLLTGKKAIWLFGQFTYETAFHFPRRTTNFRYYLAKIEGQNVMDRALGISQYGNDAD